MKLRMLLREMGRYFLLGHFLICCAGSVCVPLECLTCNDNNTVSDSCTICQNNSQCIDEMSTNIPSSCRKDFRVSVNSSVSTIEEGDDISLTCDHNLPNLNLTFGWKHNGNLLTDKNEVEFFEGQVLSRNSGKYMCFVISMCGTYESPPHDVTVNNKTVIILVICGVAALVLVLFVGLMMKCKMKRDAAKHKKRARERALATQSGGPIPAIPRDP